MKREKLKVLIIAFTCLLTAISCQHKNEKSDDLVFAEVTIRLNGQQANMGPDYVTSFSVVSAFVSAVPDSFYPFTPSTDLGAGYDESLLDLVNNTVTLSVPLNTAIRLAKVTYTSDLTLAEMLAGGTQPSFLGSSDAFTVTADTTTLAVEVVMETVAGATQVLGGTVQGKDLSLSGNSNWFAGDGTTATAVAGTGTAAKVASPYGATTDGTYLYVTDKTRAVIYRIKISDSVVEIIAGQDGVTGNTNNSVGTLATFESPTGITFLSQSSGDVLYVTDQVSHVIRRIKLSGTNEVTTVAGSAGINALTDDTTGTNARFYSPYGITSGPDGDYLYVADRLNHAIRKISITFPNAVTTFAGGTLGFTDDTGTSAQFNNPTDIILASNGFLYATDMTNGTVRKIEISSQAVTSLLSQYTLNYPRGLSTDGTSLYVADTDNYKIQIIPLATGTPAVLSGAGTAGCTEGNAGGSEFTLLKGLVSDGTNLFGVDNTCGRVFKVE